MKGHVSGFNFSTKGNSRLARESFRNKPRGLDVEFVINNEWLSGLPVVVGVIQI